MRIAVIGERLTANEKGFLKELTGEEKLQGVVYETFEAYRAASRKEDFDLMVITRSEGERPDLDRIRRAYPIEAVIRLDFQAKTDGELAVRNNVAFMELRKAPEDFSGLIGKFKEAVHGYGNHWPYQLVAGMEKPEPKRRRFSRW